MLSDFQAGSPYENCTPMAAAQFMAAAAAAGFTGGVLCAIPNGVAGTVEQTLPADQFAAQGITPTSKAQIACNFAGKTNQYNVALCILFLTCGAPWSAILP